MDRFDCAVFLIQGYRETTAIHHFDDSPAPSKTSVSPMDGLGQVSDLQQTFEQESHLAQFDEPGRWVGQLREDFD